MLKSGLPIIDSIDTDKPIREQGYKYRKVIIGNNVWIASNVFIMPGVEIGDGCIISAGSVVRADKYPPYTILSGNPAVKTGIRKNKNHVNDTRK